MVVIFAGGTVARHVMKAAKRRLYPNRMDRFVWIASDAWCCRDQEVHDLESVAEGSISVTPLHYPLHGFGKYFRSLRPENNRRNPWFKEFWQDYFECNLNDVGPNRCNQSLAFGEELPQSPSLHFVRDAFHALAIAFHNIHQLVCNGTNGICPEMSKLIINGPFLANQIHQVQFRGLSRGLLMQTTLTKELISR